MRLELMRRTDLALRALLELDRAGDRTKGAALAERVGATAGFLPQVLTPLLDRGWIMSEPGPTGGYRLAVALDDLSVLDLIEASEGPTDSGRCVLVGGDCSPSDPCALHEPWTRARTALMDELAMTPIGQGWPRSRTGDQGSPETETTP